MNKNLLSFLLLQPELTLYCGMYKVEQSQKYEVNYLYIVKQLLYKMCVPPRHGELQVILFLLYDNLYR